VRSGVSRWVLLSLWHRGTHPVSMHVALMTDSCVLHCRSPLWCMRSCRRCQPHQESPGQQQTAA
jgi:hypothetical protein